MKTYSLVLESGPKKRKTLVHVSALPGCVAVGPTTEEAVAATPEAIRAFLRFLARHGEKAEPEEDFEVTIEKHVMEGGFIGQGDPVVTVDADLAPIDDDETARLLEHFAWTREALAAWAESQPDAVLDAETERGRENRKILLHVLPGAGGYLSAHLRGAKGFSRLHTEVERGQVPIPEALRRTAVMAAERVWEATPEERAAVYERSGTMRSLRKALRRMLEHDWEHLAELSRRPHGPQL